MRASTLSAVAIPIAMWLISSPAGAADELPDISRGARLYSENCGRCHNPRGPGEFSDAHWPLIITHMRVIAGLPGEHARAIQEFLIASNNPSPRRLAAVRTTTLSGGELIQRSGCRGCHVIGGSGGTIGPKLDDVFERRSQDWIRSQIQNPREQNPKSVMPELGLTNSEVTAIIGTLRQMQE